MKKKTNLVLGERINKAYMTKSKTLNKKYGAFYSSSVLASFLAAKTLPLCDVDDKRAFNCVDPAVGDSSLLNAVEKQSVSIERRIFLGLDIRKEAIEESKRAFKGRKCNAYFLQRDALFPQKNQSSITGWKDLIKRKMPEGIHLFVSNPPWGTDLSKYLNLDEHFSVANGQFDIYDLFVELIVNNLQENGVFGLILPDSIYSQEHLNVRKKLLQETELYHIVRLGEGFFSDVNTAVSIIIGKKRVCENSEHSISCSHLNNIDRKNIFKGSISLTEAVDEKAHKIVQNKLVSSNYMFLTDVLDSDESLLSRLDHLKKVDAITTCFRGVELSKKGHICQCNFCSSWFPFPRGKEIIKCPSCLKNVTIEQAQHQVIISKEKKKGYKKIIVGEDIDRFFPRSYKFLKENFTGINYKSKKLYQNEKILVRKTGVGITACIDYDGCFTNQVVYILHVRKEFKNILTPEFLLAILNSRVVTYYLIKKFGYTEWKTHPYMTQKMLGMLPVPNFDYPEFSECVEKITDCVKRIVEKKEISTLQDIELEKYIGQLFHLSENDWSIIFSTIENVQQLIPFKRLLNITKSEVL